MPLSKITNALFGRKETNTELQPSGLGPAGTIEALVNSLPESLKWEWDDRFGCVVAAFEVGDSDRMLSAINAQLGEGWDRASISNAPGKARKAIKDFGGLQANQQLFACGLSDDVMLLGLWWPWGHGATISIRFVPYSMGASVDEVDAMRATLKTSFGL